MSDNTVYLRKGYNDRQDYLRCIADDYEVDNETVFTLAELLGESEDFDGLISSLNDM